MSTTQARYICKQCGAESPAGIGYVLGPGKRPERSEPDPTCPNQHVNAWLVIGVWGGHDTEDERAHALVAMPGNTKISRNNRISAPSCWSRSIVCEYAHEALDLAEEQVRAEDAKLRGGQR